MALQKQNVPILLGGGLDTKSDKKTVLPGKLLRAENVVFKKRNRLDKRPGYELLSHSDVSGADLPSGDSLATFNDELLLYGGQKLYSYASGAKRWVDKGAVVSAIVRTRQVIKNTYEQTAADSATLGGITVYAWEDGRGGVRASAHDEESGAIVLDDVSLDASASRPRVIAFGRYLYAFYYKSGSLYCRRLNPLAPAAFDAAVTVSATVNTAAPTYDVIPYRSTRILFAHNVQGAAQVKIGWLTEAIATTLTTHTVAEAATNSVALVLGPSETFCLAYQNVTDGVRACILNQGGAVAHGPLTVEAITTANVVNITGYKTSSGVTLLYERAAAATYNTLTRQCTVTTAGVAGTPADFLRSVGLWSKAFSYTDADNVERHYVGVVHSSTLQATFFVARSDGLIVAKQQASLARGLTSRPILANVWSPEAGVFAYTLVNKTRLVSENATLYSMTGVARTSLDFTAEDVFTAAQLGKNLHIVGGVLGLYDGAPVVEHGFHLYPENLAATPATSGGSMADGAYQYIAVFEWTDNHGQLHRSAPSVALDATVSGGSGSGSVTVTVPTLRLTGKNGTIRSSVSVALYRNEADGGEVFYRVSSISSPSYNTTTADSIDIVDTLADASIVSREILYTTGGTLDNEAPPSSSAVAIFKNRVWLGGLEDGSQVWFSKEHKAGEPVEFSGELKKDVEPTGGDVRQLAVLDDKLIFLKADRYYYTFGDGPNNTGALGEFADPVFRTADVGIEDTTSVVRVPDGIMLKTAKGIYLIDGNLAPSYIGDGVEDFNGYTVTSAELATSVNQVRFTTDGGPVLVYDYYFREWGTFTKLESKDSVTWLGRYVLLRASGVVWREDAILSKDCGAPINVALGTGWLALASLVGFQRVYRFFFVGEYKSPHKLRVGVAYDFSDAVTDYYTFDPDDALSISRYGDTSPFGDDDVYGGVNAAYRFVAHLRQQKCEAIRFVIEELTTAATEGSQEAFNVTALGLEVGAKAGMAKLRAQQKLGAS
jgi:hypothetical protein